MNVKGMQRTDNRSPTLLAIGLATLMGCTGSNEGGAPETAPMSAIAMADNLCSLCHGLTGESVSPLVPKLAGQQKDYLTSQLTDFTQHGHTEVPGNRYMGGLTHLTGTQIVELADYFSSQSAMKAQADTPDARGESIFRQGLPQAGVAACSSCHGADGRGNGQVPRVAGQHAMYMARQILRLQQSVQRPHGAPMQQVDHALSQVDAQSVAQYMATLGARQ
ncbi:MULTISPECIES: c-type cytochrome [Pseudomonas]|jgi:cytochrome c553|uniref:c-type cytochrome n=1 Tax=Pseudomonas TaxID=286 RepID=UPI000D8F04A4|nr:MULTISPECIES: c-type cytochrome [Pseudomonas]MBD0678543.1 cytochrome C [Pseudomonas sp. PSB11]MCK8682969.1 c-type cytochrome [Pseudomonas umsongensis]